MTETYQIIVNGGAKALPLSFWANRSILAPSPTTSAHVTRQLSRECRASNALNREAKALTAKPRPV